VDQSCVVLTASQEELVEKLAENEHNIWARDRIRQGWSFGPQQVEINILLKTNNVNVILRIGIKMPNVSICSTCKWYISNLDFPSFIVFDVEIFSSIQIYLYSAFHNTYCVKAALQKVLT